NRRSRETFTCGGTGARGLCIPEARRHARGGDQREEAAAKAKGGLNTEDTESTEVVDHGDTADSQNNGITNRFSTNLCALRVLSVQSLSGLLCGNLHFIAGVRERQYS